MKKFMKLLFGVLLIIGIHAKGFSQSSPVSSGGVATGKGGTATYSVGEVAYNTITGKGGIVIEGLQQTYNPADLPVSLLQLTAVINEKKEVEISWITISEFNNQYFTVERSKDGVSFEDINKTQSSGSSISKKSYQVVDDNALSGISYYRLKQTDVDGKTSFSSIVSVNNPASESVLTAFPNPTVSYLNLQVANTVLKDLKYEIYSFEGKLISQQTITNNLTSISTSNLVTGTYILRVTNEKGLIKSFKIIKN